MIERIPCDPSFERTVYLTVAQDIDSCEVPVNLDSKLYVLFIAMQYANVSNERLIALAESNLEAGMAYCCAWGPGCEHFHDIVDECALAIDQQTQQESVIMTTWHDKETLKESLWFAIFSAFPDAAYENSCSSVVIEVIGNEAWATEVRESVTDLHQLSIDVVGEENA